MSYRKNRPVFLFSLFFISVMLAFSPASAEEFAFPADLNTIEEEAFADSGVSGRIVIPSWVKQIHGRAFANCGLTEVVFPEWIEYIAADAFEGCDSLKVTAVEGSYAEKWAISRGYIQTAEASVTNYYEEMESEVAGQLGIDEAASGKESDDSISGREFMNLLDWFMSKANPQALEAWKNELPKVRTYDGPLNRGEAMVAITYAAEFAGGAYAKNLDQIYKENTQGLEWYDNYIVDEGLFGEILHDVCSIYSYWNDDRYLGAYKYLEEHCSILYDQPILDQADNGSFNLEKPLTTGDAERAVTRFLFVDPEKLEKDYAEIRTPVKEKIAEVRDQGEEALEKILNADSEYEVGESGTVYYVSPSGNDENDGKSPETAWRSLDKVNSGGILYDYMANNPEFPEYLWAAEHPELTVQFQEGDVVLFERGGEWRGVLRTAPGVTYSAYGTGSKPKISGSPEDAGDAGKWSLAPGTTNVWLYHRDIQECGGIRLGDSVVAQKRPVVWTGEKFVFSEDITNNYLYLTREEYNQLPTLDLSRLNNLEFINAQKDQATLGLASKGKLYLRCDAGNPGEVYSSIEFFGGDLNAHNEGLAMLRDRTVLDNLEFCYFAGCGVVTSDYGTVRSCVVGWGGGTINCYDIKITEDEDGLFFDFGGRYGDGICTGDDYNIVRNNYVYNLWDNGVSIEAYSGGDNGSNPETVESLIERVGNLVQGNVVQSCGGGIMMADWVAMEQRKIAAGFVDNTIESNLIFDSGCSPWAHVDSLQGAGAICINIPSGGSSGNVVSNNIMCGTPTEDVAVLNIWSAKDLSAVTYSDNVYAQQNREALLSVKREYWDGENENTVTVIRNAGKKYNPDSPILSEKEIFERFEEVQ